MSKLDANSTFMNIPLKFPREKVQLTTLEEKRMVLNNYERLKKQNSKISTVEIARLVNRVTGIDRITIFRIIREYKNTHKLKMPKVRRRRQKCMDKFLKNAVCRIVHDFFFKNKFPTLNKVLAVVNEDGNLPQFKRPTFYGLLKSMNFKFICRGRDNMLIEKEEIVLWRRQYLRALSKYRREGRKIYYLGETCFSSECGKSDVWYGRYKDLKKTTEEGVIVCHIGSNKGFVKEGLWVFKSNKLENCAEEMSCASFEHWFVNVLQHLEDNSVIVMDNAPCHSRRVEQIPTAATKKVDIELWLTKKQIPFDGTLIKVELLDIVRMHKLKYNKYICDELAQQCNKIVLRLPPYHNELNPIETIWTQLKNEITACSMTFKFGNVCEAVNSITWDKWRDCVDYVHNTVEPWMWKLDNLMELQTDFTECFVS
ncbi:uncharacterized protein LOC108915825 [Anoplophora glabripennis]|uniref:uncharacterized protein LOC108915825 n=1 Tax=Anoplophora glabripennis TaxID=217634 RepID=UPI0008743D28|nr:uncharacterized protein LOC108915825 [Anoplophora glabripennis]